MLSTVTQEWYTTLCHLKDASTHQTWGSYLKELRYAPGTKQIQETRSKGHYYATNLRKVTGNSPNFDVVNINAYIKFGEILSICSQDIERKQNLTSIKGHNSIKNLQKLTGNNPKLHFVIINAHTKFGWILSISSLDTIVYIV